MDDQAVTSLAEDWRHAGIRTGDLVLIHSSLRRTVRRCVQGGMPGAVGDILDSFREAVGDTGTLLFPLFNFEFTEGVAFDIRTTPSQMGVLTETARQLDGAVRTGASDLFLCCDRCSRRGVRGHRQLQWVWR